jgi:hypothetical protein
MVFQGFLDDLANGVAPVVESNHILLIGLTGDTVPVIQQLCTAYEEQGGACIAVLSDEKSKPEMEELISGFDIDKKGSTIVVRGGKAEKSDDLLHVSADSASTIVIMADKSKPKELRDAFVLQSLVSIRSEGWPTNGQVVCVCSLERNYNMLTKIGGEGTNVVLLDHFLSKLMVQISDKVNFGSIVSQTLGFEASEFYIKDTPEHLVGKSFYDASFHYPNSVLVGTIRDKSSKQSKKQASKRFGQSKSDINMCPSKYHKLSAD